MSTADLLLVLVVYAQPPLLGLVLTLTLWPGLRAAAWGPRHWGLRLRAKTTRFFECAAYGRLAGWVRYGSQALALCTLFLLYDIDLVLFVAEVTAHEGWAPAHACLLGAYAGFFLAGLAYDAWRYGLSWA